MTLPRIGIDTDGLVYGCGCGTVHPVERSAIEDGGRKWTAIRTRVLDRGHHRCQVQLPEGGYCGAPATVAGHVLARVLGGCDRPGNMRAECSRHSASDGQQLGQHEREVKRLARLILDRQQDSLTSVASTQESVAGTGSRNEIRCSVFVDHAPNHDPAAAIFSPVATLNEPSVTTEHPPSPGPEDSVWDAAPWLEAVREVPENATWPRYMTAPHPHAVGTYGMQVIESMESHGNPARYWQHLAALRLLEHDDAGDLVWAEYLATLSRQGGKSILLSEMAWWRLTRSPQQWGQQEILHMARDKSLVLKVMGPARNWAEAGGLWVNRKTGDEHIATVRDAYPRWSAITEQSAGIGSSGSLALVDEAWDVSGSTVDDGLLPTTVERPSSQLGLWSTAHRKATGLILDRRPAYLAELAAPQSQMLLEWSAPWALERADPVGWRMASPHWSPRREALVGRALQRAQAGESLDPTEPDPTAAYDAQWLNRWPGVRTAPVPVGTMELATPDDLQACRDDDVEPSLEAPIFLTLEDDAGGAAAAAAAGLLGDGRVAFGGGYFPSRGAACQWLADVSERFREVVVLVGASLAEDPDVAALELPVEKIGRSETAGALATLRELLRTQGASFDGRQVELAGELAGTRVRRLPTGGLIVHGHGRSALLRCAAWAVQSAHRDRL